MFASRSSLTKPLLTNAASSASIFSSDPEELPTSSAASPASPSPDSLTEHESPDAPSQGTRSGWAAWWLRRFAASPAPPSPSTPNAVSPPPSPVTIQQHQGLSAAFAPTALPTGAAPAPPDSWGIPEAAKTPGPGPGHTLGVLIGVLGCGMLGAVFGMQYAGRLTVGNGTLEEETNMNFDRAWMYLPILTFFGAKAACFGWAVAQLHRGERWTDFGLWSATTRNIQTHENPALRRRLHRRMALGVAVGVCQSAFLGWHYATLYGGGWRMAVYPYLLPVVDLPATWATSCCLFVPLADACGQLRTKRADVEVGTIFWQGASAYPALPPGAGEAAS